MDGFEYTVTPPGLDGGRRWRWDDGVATFSESAHGGEILDWSDVVSGKFSGADM